MSQQERFWTARLSDRAVLEIFSDLAEIRPSQATVNVVGISQQIDLPAKAQNTPLWTQLIELDEYAVRDISLPLPGCNLHYFRGGQLAVTHERPDFPSNPHFDEVVVQNIASESDQSVRIQTLAAISKAFSRVQFDPSQQDSSAHLAALQESRLEQLEKLNRDLVQVGIDYRKRIDEEIDEKRSKIDAQFDAKVAALEAEVQEKASALDDRARELDEEKKRLDDSDNTTARRNIRDRMLEDVRLRTERFGVSDATVGKRRPVQIAMQVAVGVLSALTLFALLEVSQADSVISAAVAPAQINATAASAPTASSSSAASSATSQASASSPATVQSGSKATGVSSTITDTLITQRWALWFRLSLVSLGLVGMLLYYIRWENGWAQRHADAEFNLQQFHVDVNRANWIIESCLEWKKSTSSDIPPELLASISRGLFSYQDKDSIQVIHPADELASALFGAASKVRLKSGDSEVELDAKKVPREAKV